MSTLWQQIEDRSIPVPFAGCLIWLGPVRRNGYGAIYDPERKKTVIAHRAAYEANKGPIPAGLLVCHSCDTPSCVNPDHLFVGTVKDNSDDMVRKSRSRKGHFPYNTVLPKETVIAIFNDTRSRKEICAIFDVAQSTVAQIKNGSQWSCVTGKNYFKQEKTHCSKGHLWNEENIGVTATRRYCKICNRLRGNANWIVRREK